MLQAFLIIIILIISSIFIYTPPETCTHNRMFLLVHNIQLLTEVGIDVWITLFAALDL